MVPKMFQGDGVLTERIPLSVESMWRGERKHGSGVGEGEGTVGSETGMGWVYGPPVTGAVLLPSAGALSRKSGRHIELHLALPSCIQTILSK